MYMCIIVACPIGPTEPIKHPSLPRPFHCICRCATVIKNDYDYHTRIHTCTYNAYALHFCESVYCLMTIIFILCSLSSLVQAPRSESLTLLGDLYYVAQSKPETVSVWVDIRPVRYSEK